MSPRCVASAILGLALCVVSGSAAHGQESQQALTARVIRLLKRAPITTAADSGPALSQREFLTLTAALLREVPASDRPLVVLRSSIDAVRELEALLSGFVPVEVLSDPPGVRVSYRRAVEANDASLVTVTTNATLSLHPGWYDFTWKDDGGNVRGERVDCATRCKVVVRGSR